MFKYFVALAFVAVASATQYYVDVEDTYVKVGNTEGFQVYFYVEQQYEKYPVIDIQFYGPEGLVKKIQVPDVKGYSQALYQIFTRYAGQQLSYPEYKELVGAIYRYVQEYNVDPVFFLALQTIDIALYSQLYQGDYYRYIQNVLNQENYGSWSQGIYAYQPYGSYGKSYQSYGQYSSGLYGSSRYTKPYGYGYFGGYQGYRKPYGYYGAYQGYSKPSYYGGYYGSSALSYNKPYGYYGSSAQTFSGPYNTGYYGSYASYKPYYGHAQQYLQGLAF